MEEYYNRIKEKYGLPEFADIDTDFEICTIEHEGHYLRDVRRKMIEKVEKIISMFDEILHPENAWASMVEEKVFTEEDSKKILTEYKRLRYYYRRNSELRIKDSDKENVEFIKELHSEWKEIQEESLVIIGKLKDSWTQELTDKEKLGYLG